MPTLMGQAARDAPPFDAVAGFAVALALGIYLIVALLKPERF